MATSDNLKEAFAGESQANRKYLAFAKKAQELFPESVFQTFDQLTLDVRGHIRLEGKDNNENNFSIF